MATGPHFFRPRQAATDTQPEPPDKCCPAGDGRSDRNNGADMKKKPAAAEYRRGWLWGYEKEKLFLTRRGV